MKFLKGQASFRVKSVIFDIMSQGSPRVVHEKYDSKKDLDDQLKSVCESFIVNITRQAFDPLMIFLKKVNL
jgi:hypothetical protein